MPLVGGVDARARAEQRSEAAYHCGGFLAQGLGAWGGDHGLSGPDQEGVLEDAAQTGEGAAHGCGRGVQTGGGAGHAVLGQQSIQRDGEIGVDDRIRAAHQHYSISVNDSVPKFPLWQHGDLQQDEGRTEPARPARFS